MTNQQRRLYRNQTNKVIAGVCSGLGEYLNVDTSQRVAAAPLHWLLCSVRGWQAPPPTPAWVGPPFNI